MDLHRTGLPHGEHVQQALGLVHGGRAEDREGDAGLAVALDAAASTA
jgi:hypothetical protein